MATSTLAAEAPPSSNKTLLIALALFATALLAAGGAAAWLAFARPAEAAATAPAAPAPIFVPLDPWTVNLQGDGRSRFLHVGVTLKVADQATQGRIAEYLPEVRSRVLTLLSNREPASLATAEDKARLAGEILAEVKRPFASGLPEQHVTHVMFTAFVLQ